LCSGLVALLAPSHLREEGGIRETDSPRSIESVPLSADTSGERTEHMERVHERPKSHRRPRADAISDKSVERGVDAKDLERELDDLLDEVDAVLEENAEEFVKAYVQKGGE
jgi:prokaryotic ubiquitin-like protein Pup